MSIQTLGAWSSILLVSVLLACSPVAGESDPRGGVGFETPAVEADAFFQAQQETLLEFELRVPNPCWLVRLLSVHQRGDELISIAELVPPPAGRRCVQAVSIARDERSVTPRDPVRRWTRVVIASTWFEATDSESPGDVVQVESAAEAAHFVEGATLLLGPSPADAATP